MEKSNFERVVCLRSWWLGTSETNKLVVAGFSNREKEARRVFTSAPIAKRHDDFNLQTADGIGVKLHGFIDQPRTLANGFESKIFQQFIFGFPDCWEEFARSCLHTASPQGANVDEGQYLTGETVGSVNNIEKHVAKQGLVTAKPNCKKGIKTDLAIVNVSTAEAEKKSPHVDESTPVHDTVPKASPEVVSFRRWQSERQMADEDIMPRCLDSSNSEKEQYLSGETLRRQHISDGEIKRHDSRQAKTSKKQKRTKKAAQSTRNSRSVKNDLASAGKRKRKISTCVNENLSKREAKKKSAHANESTPVPDMVPMVSPEAGSFRRSRSGRLLLPALEFWHNQRAVYDVDRKIIGVEGFLDH